MAQDGTYFVRKKDLLQWINSTLALHITKIEQVDSVYKDTISGLLAVIVLTVDALVACEACGMPCRHARELWPASSWTLCMQAPST